MQTIIVSHQSHGPCKEEAASPMSAKGLLLRDRDGTSYFKKWKKRNQIISHFFSAFQLQLDGAELLTQGRKEGREMGDQPKQTPASPGPVSPKEGHVWVATLGQTGSEHFLSVPLCSWMASCGGPGTKKHLP